MEQLTQAELDERIAIIKRFRMLLEQQRTKFREYLKVLELQESKINQEDAEALIAHSELETQIVEGIGSLQKVIVPMQELYARSNAATYNPHEAVPVESLQKDLMKLQFQVLEQNKKNRSLLKSHMTKLREQISSFKNPYHSLNSVYAKKSNAGSLVSINS